MPPPKKPKTGVSRVEEYLNDSERMILSKCRAELSFCKEMPFPSPPLADMSPDDELTDGTGSDGYSPQTRENGPETRGQCWTENNVVQGDCGYIDDRCRPLIQSMLFKYRNKNSGVSNGGDRSFPEQEGERSFPEHSSQPTKSRLIDLIKTRKVDALFHAMRASSPPPDIYSFELRNGSSSDPGQNHAGHHVQGRCKNMGTQSLAGEVFEVTPPASPVSPLTVYTQPPPVTPHIEDDVPLDFSRPRNMSVNGIDGNQSFSPTYRVKEFGKKSPPYSYGLAAPLNDSPHYWPPSGDERSLSPGEWRPGMPPVVERQDVEQTSAPPPAGDGIRERGLVSPPHRARYELTPMSSAQETPGGVRINHWEPVDRSSGEKEEMAASSSGQTDVMARTTAASSTPLATPVTTAAASNHELPTSTMDEPQHFTPRRYATDKNMNCSRRCQICNDMASGFHYGVWSCEGCKAFFKRSLQGPVDYVCPATNSCTIDKHRRKSCQACRLRKCIEMGMNRGKKGPRGPRGPNKRKNTVMNQDTEPVLKHIKKEIVDDQVSSGVPAPPVVEPKDQYVAIHPLAEYLMKIDLPRRSSDHDVTQPDTETTVMSSVMKLADCELVDIINWAKSIPGYTELQLSDRIHLLEASWMEVLLLGLLSRSVPYSNDGVLVFATDLHMDRKRSEAAGCLPVFEKLLALAKKFAALQLKEEEVVLLRALLLFNADVALLPNLSKVDILREKLLDALHFTCNKRCGRPSEEIYRLLLFLPHIRHCALIAIDHMYELKQKKGIPLFELLQEMLESRKPTNVRAPREWHVDSYNMANTSHMTGQKQHMSSHYVKHSEGIRTLDMNAPYSTSPGTTYTSKLAPGHNNSSSVTVSPQHMATHYSNLHSSNVAENYQRSVSEAHMAASKCSGRRPSGQQVCHNAMSPHSSHPDHGAHYRDDPPMHTRPASGSPHHNG